MKTVEFPEQEKSKFQMHTRKEVIKVLKRLYEEGYRYVVRDKDMPVLCCYSLKPKRYMDMEAWGYVNALSIGAMMAYPIKNKDVTEINYLNRSATLISDFLDEATLFQWRRSHGR